MADKNLSEEEQKLAEKLAEIINPNHWMLLRQIINREGAVENNFYLQYLPAKSIEVMRGWMWFPFEQILAPEEAERFKKFRVLLTDPIDVLLDVSKKATTQEEYLAILTEKFKWQLADLTQIHPLAFSIRFLSYDKKRIEKAISIIITTVSQWDAKAMVVHKELLRVFRPDDQSITHADIIPMRLDTEKSRLFACYYPWGGNYAESLQTFLEENGIEWREDPRTSGSDCYGMLIAEKDGNLDKAVELLETCETSLQEKFKYDTDEFDEDGYWEAVSEARWNLDLSKVGVIDISTDWKHLETYDHAEALLKIGVQMTQTRSEILELELFTLELV